MLVIETGAINQVPPIHDAKAVQLFAYAHDASSRQS